MGASTCPGAGGGRRALRLGRWRFEVRRWGSRGGDEELRPLRFQDRFAARAFVRRCLEDPRNARLLRELLQREHPTVGCRLEESELVELLAGMIRCRRLRLVRSEGTPGSGSGAGKGAVGQQRLTAAGVMEEVAFASFRLQDPGSGEQP